MLRIGALDCLKLKAIEDVSKHSTKHNPDCCCNSESKARSCTTQVRILCSVILAMLINLSVKL